MNRLFIKIENLCDRMDSLEKKNDQFINKFHYNLPPLRQSSPPSLLPNPTFHSRNSRTFASVISPYPNPSTKIIPPPPLRQLPPVPKNSFINQFKMGQVIIRAKFGLPHPFPNLSAADIANKVNSVLDNLEHEDLPFSIKVKAVTKFPSGDIKFFTQNRLGARWLLTTNIAGPI